MADTIPEGTEEAPPTPDTPTPTLTAIGSGDSGAWNSANQPEWLETPAWLPPPDIIPEPLPTTPEELSKIDLSHTTIYTPQGEVSETQKQEVLQQIVEKQINRDTSTPKPSQPDNYLELQRIEQQMYDKGRQQATVQVPQFGTKEYIEFYYNNPKGAGYKENNPNKVVVSDEGEVRVINKNTGKPVSNDTLQITTKSEIEKMKTEALRQHIEQNKSYGLDNKGKDAIYFTYNGKDYGIAKNWVTTNPNEPYRYFIDGKWDTELPRVINVSDTIDSMVLNQLKSMADKEWKSETIETKPVEIKNQTLSEKELFENQQRVLYGENWKERLQELYGKEIGKGVLKGKDVDFLLKNHYINEAGIATEKGRAAGLPEVAVQQMNVTPQDMIGDRAWGTLTVDSLKLVRPSGTDMSDAAQFYTNMAKYDAFLKSKQGDYEAGFQEYLKANPWITVDDYTKIAMASSSLTQKQKDEIYKKILGDLPKKAQDAPSPTMIEILKKQEELNNYIIQNARVDKDDHGKPAIYFTYKGKEYGIAENWVTTNPDEPYRYFIDGRWDTELPGILNARDTTNNTVLTSVKNIVDKNGFSLPSKSTTIISESQAEKAEKELNNVTAVIDIWNKLATGLITVITQPKIVYADSPVLPKTAILTVDDKGQPAIMWTTPKTAFEKEKTYGISKNWVTTDPSKPYRFYDGVWKADITECTDASCLITNNEQTNAKRWVDIHGFTVQPTDNKPQPKESEVQPSQEVLDQALKAQQDILKKDFDDALTVLPEKDKKLYTEEFKKNPVAGAWLAGVSDEAIKKIASQDYIDKLKEHFKDSIYVGRDEEGEFLMMPIADYNKLPQIQKDYITSVGAASLGSFVKAQYDVLKPYILRDKDNNIISIDIVEALRSPQPEKTIAVYSLFTKEYIEKETKDKPINAGNIIDQINVITKLGNEAIITGDGTKYRESNLRLLEIIADNSSVLMDRVTNPTYNSKLWMDQEIPEWLKVPEGSSGGVLDWIKEQQQNYQKVGLLTFNTSDPEQKKAAILAQTMTEAIKSVIAASPDFSPIATYQFINKDIKAEFDKYFNIPGVTNAAKEELRTQYIIKDLEALKSTYQSKYADNPTILNQLITTVDSRIQSFIEPNPSAHEAAIKLWTTVEEITQKAREIDNDALRFLGAGGVMIGTLLAVPALMGLSGIDILQHSGKAVFGKTSEREEQGDTALMETVGLGAGALGFFLSLPGEIKKDPVFGIPYSLAALFGGKVIEGIKKAPEISRDVLEFFAPGRSGSPKVVLADSFYIELDPRIKGIDSDKMKLPASVAATYGTEALGRIQRLFAEEFYNKWMDAQQTGYPKDAVIQDKELNIQIEYRVTPEQRVTGTPFNHLARFGDPIINEINSPKKSFTVKTKEEAAPDPQGNKPKFDVAFGSQHTVFGAASFYDELTKNMLILKVLYAPKEIQKVPVEVRKLLLDGDTQGAITLLYDMVRNKKTPEGIYEAFKYGFDENGKFRYEFELIATPGMKFNAIKAPWYMKDNKIDTAVLYTRSPLEAPTAGVKYGEKIPVLYVATDKAVKGGYNKPPTLAQLYIMEMWALVTYLRKLLSYEKAPKLTKAQELEGVAYTRSSIRSRLEAVKLSDIEKDPGLAQLLQIDTMIKRGEGSIYLEKGIPNLFNDVLDKGVNNLKEMLISGGLSPTDIKKPTGMPSLFAMGDRHGAISDILNLARRKGIIDASGKVSDGKMFAALGDYTDRGKRGIPTLKALMELDKKPGTLIAVLGNHDANILAMSYIMQPLNPRQIQLLKFFTGEIKTDVYKSLKKTGLNDRQIKNNANYKKTQADIYKELINSGVDKYDIANVSRFVNSLGGFIKEAVEIANNLTIQKWLQDRPAMAKYGDDLLIHANTSEFYQKYGSTIDEVNMNIANMLKTKDGALRVYSEMNRQRGFDKTSLNDLLSQYGASRVIHGHSPTRSGKTEVYLEGKAVDINDIWYATGEKGHIFQATVDTTPTTWSTNLYNSVSAIFPTYSAIQVLNVIKKIINDYVNASRSTPFMMKDPLFELGKLIVEQAQKIAKGEYKVPEGKVSEVKPIEEVKLETAKPLTEADIKEIKKSEVEYKYKIREGDNPYINDFPPDISEGYVGKVYLKDDMRPSTFNSHLAYAISKLPDDIARNYDGHGIAKGYDLESLISLLKSGVSNDKTFSTAPLYNPDLASAIGATGAYSHGGFIILAEYGKPLYDGKTFSPKYVLVNDSHYHAIPRLQEAFPNVEFIRASKIGELLPKYKESTIRGEAKPAISTTDTQITTQQFINDVKSGNFKYTKEQTAAILESNGITRVPSDIEMGQIALVLQRVLNGENVVMPNGSLNFNVIKGESKYWNTIQKAVAIDDAINKALQTVKGKSSEILKPMVAKISEMTGQAKTNIEAVTELVREKGKESIDITSQLLTEGNINKAIVNVLYSIIGGEKTELLKAKADSILRRMAESKAADVITWSIPEEKILKSIISDEKYEALKEQATSILNQTKDKVAKSTEMLVQELSKVPYRITGKYGKPSEYVLSDWTLLKEGESIPINVITRRVPTEIGIDIYYSKPISSKFSEGIKKSWVENKIEGSDEMVTSVDALHYFDRKTGKYYILEPHFDMDIVLANKSAEIKKIIQDFKETKIESSKWKEETPKERIEKLGKEQSIQKYGEEANKILANQEITKLEPSVSEVFNQMKVIHDKINEKGADGKYILAEESATRLFDIYNELRDTYYEKISRKESILRDELQSLKDIKRNLEFSDVIIKRYKAGDLKAQKTFINEWITKLEEDLRISEEIKRKNEQYLESERNKGVPYKPREKYRTIPRYDIINPRYERTVTTPRKEYQPAYAREITKPYGEYQYKSTNYRPPNYQPPYERTPPYTPPYTSVPPYTPPYTPTITRIPPYTPPPPPIIPPIVPPRRPPRDKKDYQYYVDNGLPEGSLAWKQGWVYRHWMPPYGTAKENPQDWFFSRKPIPGVPYEEGIGSAYASIVRLGGEIPDELHYDMGLQKLTIKKGDRGKNPEIFFELDEKDASWSPENKAERELKEETETPKYIEVEGQKYVAVKSKKAKIIEEPKEVKTEYIPQETTEQIINKPEIKTIIPETKPAISETKKEAKQSDIFDVDSLDVSKDIFEVNSMDTESIDVPKDAFEVGDVYNEVSSIDIEPEPNIIPQWREPNKTNQTFVKKPVKKQNNQESIRMIR